jgi:hypothetical protein
MKLYVEVKLQSDQLFSKAQGKAQEKQQVQNDFLGVHHRSGGLFGCSRRKTIIFWT